ncbi:MAG: monofunctional biosynthetic peptidoglycan transglycosylase [Bacteroidota bacterium]
MFLKILKWLFKIGVSLIVFSVVLTAVYTVIAPPLTPLMLIRVVEGAIDAKPVGITKDWESYDNISPHIFRAVIAAEDGKFLKHEGFDWKAIENARKRNERLKGKKVYGASTISMQTAKNGFLWPGRSYIRKAIEAYFTVLIEALWGKKRILEVYVNIIEWGPGIYGVEAASQTYFGKPAKNLTGKEAALLAAVLPNPRRWSPAKPTAYINKRRSFIQARMAGIALPKE